MVAILIFALGILGLVAMGGTAVLRSPMPSTAPRRAASPTRSQARSRSASTAPTTARRRRRSPTSRTSPTRLRRRRPRRALRRHRVRRRRTGLGAAQPRRQPDTAPARVARCDGGQPADLRRCRRQLQPRRHHAVLEDGERRRLASSHRSSPTSTEADMCARTPSSRRRSPAASRSSRSWSASPSA